MGMDEFRVFCTDIYYQLKHTRDRYLTFRDIEKFCNFLGHLLLEKKIEDKEFYYLVEKRDKNIIETNLEN